MKWKIPEVRWFSLGEQMLILKGCGPPSKVGLQGCNFELILIKLTFLSKKNKKEVYAKIMLLKWGFNNLSYLK